VTFTIYDKPGVLGAQILENEVTLEGLKNLALNPKALSLQERTDLGDMLKGESSQTSAFEETIKSTLTNPFVWLYFATSPAAAQIGKKGVTLFGSTAKQRAVESLKKYPGIAQSLNLLTRNQVTYHSNTMRAASTQITKGLEEGEEVRAAVMGMNGEHVKAFQKRHGLYKGLDPAAYASGTPEREKAEDIARAVWVRARGWHLDARPQTRAQGRQVWIHTLEDGSEVTIESKGVAEDLGREIAKRKREYSDQFKRYAAERKVWEEETQDWIAGGMRGERPVSPMPPSASPVKESISEIVEITNTTDTHTRMVDKDQLFAVFDEYDGLEDLYWKNQEAQRTMLRRVVGKDDLGTETFFDDRGVRRTRAKVELDDDKLERIGRSFSHELWNEGAVLEKSAETLEGRAMLSKVLGPEMMQSIGLGKIPEDEIVKQLRNVYEPVTRGESYIPLNTIEGFDLPRVRASTDYIHTMHNYGHNVPLAKSLTPATQAEHIWHPEDLDGIIDRFGGTRELRILRQSNLDTLAKRNQDGLETAVLRTDAWRAWDDYHRDMTETWAVHVQPLDDATRNAWVAETKDLPEDVAGKLGRPSEMTSLGDGPPNLPTPADAMGWSFRAQLDPHSQKSYATTFLPLLLHRKHDVRHALLTGQFYEAKRAFSSVAKTPPIQSLKKWEWGRRLVNEMERLGDPKAKMRGGVGIAGPVANLLYVSHLGLNLGSMALNATQPFLLAGTALGARNVVLGYQRAFGELANYAKARYAKYGVRLISPAQRNELIEQNFKFADETGIMATTQELLDSAENRARFKRGGKLEQLLIDLPMKGFEKTEWLNRTVAAHATEIAFERSGRSFTRTQISNNVRSLVDESQFGLTEGNTPAIFRNNPLGDNPLMRQFFGFQLRSLTSLVHTFPRLAGGTRAVPAISPLRLFGVDEISGTIPVLANDILRGMGLSAIIYEAGKGMLGADLSRGLFFESSTELLGVGAFTDPNEDLIPIPPVIDIPVDFIRGVSTNDVQLMRNTFSRLLPGGVGISRLLGSAPQTEIPILEQMQRRHIGWDEAREDGSVPVYDWDGSLIKYARPQEIILAGLGADLGRFRQSSELDGFLVQNRDEIVRYRQGYLRALAGNDHARAQQLARTFERRFGVPLTVTRDQIRSFQKTREVPRSERILDRIDPALRDQYAEFLQRSESQSLPVDVTQGATAAKRRENQTPSPVGLNAGSGRQPFADFEPFETY